jgi:tRNA(Ile)-lysidine synthase
MNESLAVQALGTIGYYNMLRPGDAIVAGLSGGADSVALLRWLCSLREEYGLSLCAAHLNHGLRGEESDGYEAFCRELCGKWGVPLHVKRVDLSGLACGVEEAGRNARYAFFGEFGRKIALAHTLSDRMETFLMNAGRGSALRGLCSIPPIRGQIVRPLIECSRAQVEKYCADNNLPFRTDSTNYDIGYRRNYIRNEVMPLLDWEPGPLRRLFRNLEADEAYLASQAKAYEGDIRAAPEALKGRLLRGMLEAQGREPSRSRIRDLEKQLHARPVETAFLPPEIKKTLQREQLDENFIKNLPEIPKEGLANCLDCDTIIGDVTAGRRRAGDRMRLCNGAGTKSFKKLCQERNIAPGAREGLLVARDALGPVWIEGFGCAHRCRLTENTTRAARVTAREE